jgi:DNA-binding transcriptional LysR family regulator
MTLQQLIYAIETDKQGSFNKAANTLYVTRQSLTSSINELERELGIKIFRRTNKGLTTTVDGFEFLGMAKSVINSHDNLSRFYSDKGSEVTRFSLASIPNFFVENAFATLCMNSSESASIKTTIRATDAYQAIDDVCSSRAEIATVMIGESHKHSWNNLVRAKGLEYSKLMDAQMEVLLSENDPLARSERIPPHLLRGYSFVFWADSTMNILNLLPDTSEFAKTIVKNNRFIKAQFHTTLFMVMEKAKVFALSYSGMNRHFRTYPVISIPLDEDLPFELVYLKRKACKLSHEASQFLQVLEDELAGR